MIAVLNTFFQDFTSISQFGTFVAGGLLLIVGITIYFAEILKNDEVLKMKNELFFWVSIGLLIFFVGYLPIKASWFFFMEKDYFKGSYMVFKTIQLSITLLMYMFFILGFIWVRKK